MQLSELQTFLAIIETGSLVKASQQLNVTQSTVTARLKSLEDEVGQTLIHRHKSGATMTAAGERLRRYANTIADLWKQARQVTALPDAMSSVCNIGCHPDLWPALGCEMFDYLSETHKGVALSVWHGSEVELARWLGDGLIDFALTYWQNANQTQETIPLLTDRLILVSTQADGPIRFNPRYVYVEAGEEFGREHAATYADADTARISFGSAVLGLDHLMQKGGSAYLPERIASPYLSDGRLFRLENAREFERKAFLIGNKIALRSWPWFNEMLELIVSE